MPPIADDLVEYIPPLWLYAKTLVFNDSDAKDLVQECLARVLEKCPSWEDVRNPHAYLFLAMRTIYIDRLKNSAREITGLATDYAAHSFSS